ncbi:tRNA (guanine-N(7)-)-methyltransferase (tRNA(m7G46)-methyltransferase) [Ascosphaera atra]|nr:tRNA (guanine-N(7)-)-methyltransferase (tRNA(m7G46)-methyltransferase) [Ascosphaera atra]
MDWSSHYPAFVDPDPSNTNATGRPRLTKNVEVADIGCGFGGLLVALAPLMPETLMVGMEIRIQVLDYVNARIKALRLQQAAAAAKGSNTAESSQTTQKDKQTTEASKGDDEATEQTALPDVPSAPTPTPPVSSASYQNISAIRSNTMKFLTNFFDRHQLSKIFICFPDPHFKARKHKARIVSASLNAEYAYVLRPGGRLYTITDVEELHYWMVSHFEGGAEGGGKLTGANAVQELWERVPEEELQEDPCVKVMMEETEEGKKVTRNKGRKFVAVWTRKEDPEWP